MLKIEQLDDGNFFIDQPGEEAVVMSFKTWAAIGRAMMNGQGSIEGRLFVVPQIQSPFDGPSVANQSTINRFLCKLAQLRRRLTAAAS